MQSSAHWIRFRAPDERHTQPQLSSYPQIDLGSLFWGISNKTGGECWEGVIDDKRDQSLYLEMTRCLIIIWGMYPTSLLSFRVFIEHQDEKGDWWDSFHGGHCCLIQISFPLILCICHSERSRQPLPIKCSAGGETPLLSLTFSIEFNSLKSLLTWTQPPFPILSPTTSLFHATGKGNADWL